MIKIGTSTFDQQRITIGTTEMQRVYIGSNLVWMKAPISGIGTIYNTYAVTDVRNIANTGWHVPTKAEADTLATYLGGWPTCVNKMKTTGMTDWNYDSGATNSSGFSGKGSGVRLTNGSFEGLYSYGGFHTSTQISTVGIYYFELDANTSSPPGLQLWHYSPWGAGANIRLIKDDSTLASYTGNDGTVYASVKINTQVWLSQSLKETRYRTGASIPMVTDNSTWAGLSTGANCWYNNDPTLG